MCELLGMSFDQPVDASFWLKGFRRRGNDNPDGWGLAWYPYEDGSIQIVKEPRKAGDSPLLGLLLENASLKSKTYLAHLRKRSSAGKGYLNTHPFYRRLGGKDGKDYCFGHNGTLHNHRWPLKCFHPIGETDSEYAFCYILECIGEKDIGQWESDDFAWLQGELREINKAGKFNCILSDGGHLFCYHDDGEHKAQLWFMKRSPPSAGLRLADDDLEVLVKGSAELGYIVATDPLTGEHWEPFQPGELIVFKNGELVFRD